MNRGHWTSLFFAANCLAIAASLHAATPKTHSVVLGAVKRVPYSKVGDPAGAAAGEDALKIRPLVVDGAVKDWTTGDAHDVTDRSFVVRRAIRLNDALPEDKGGRWVWQRGPWVLIDRVNGHVAPLRLPNYDPGVSQVRWFRDYGAYCGITASGKSLYAVVAQVSVRRPVLSKKISAFNVAQQDSPACEPPDWQREPLRITFRPAGKDVISYNFVPGSAMLVEDSGDDEDMPANGADTSVQ